MENHILQYNALCLLNKRVYIKFTFQLENNRVQNINRIMRGNLLVPVSSSLLPNFYDSIFIIHKDNQTLRFPPDIVSLIPSTGVNVLKIGQRLFI